ncbi:MAG: hypothetical protein C0609_03185 [Deltaproteobacteria bacterium]|nr:MAG: hypothetical protein C0609_03185 [Deltaproteobacteria bacterium]
MSEAGAIGRFTRDEARKRVISIGSITGGDARRSLWVELIGQSVPEFAALAIDVCVREAFDELKIRLAWSALLDFSAVVERAGPGRFSEILRAANAIGLEGPPLILEYSGPNRGADKLPPLPDPLGDRLSLGHKKTAARGMRSHLLERLLKDPDPRVVREVLRNPRLREEEVLAIASRRPSSEELFNHLARATRWIVRQPVARAIAMNPYAPVRLALMLMVTLPDTVLAEAAKIEGLHPAVRSGALKLIALRGERV